MWVAALMLIVAGSLAVSGAVLWLRWGRRKAGVSLLSAGVILALFLTVAWFTGRVESGPL